MGSTILSERPHAVCIPFPAQGHVNPMLKLAKLLHHKGFHITFLNPEFNRRQLLKSRGANSLNGLSSFRFETIPDYLRPTDVDAARDLPSFCESTRKTGLAPFRELLSKLNDTSSSDVPPVTCIIADGGMTFTLDAAEELGIPEVLFWTTSACGFLAYVHVRTLIEKDVSYLTDGYLDNVIDFLPGMKGIRLKDMPSFIRTTDKDDPMIDIILDEIERAKRASAIILNTFNSMEHQFLSALPSMLPPIYSIGPLQLLLNQVPDTDLKRFGSNLWKEEPECLEWLGSMDPNSVVYVNFGSSTVMTLDQLVEFAWGLANSEQTFLWIIRPDLVFGDSAILPPEFLADTKDRALLASWCPQEQVLNHPAIRGFLTHSGWNSTIESVCGGVPMLCWPFFAEQQTNCRYCCTEWGIGMEINNDVNRDEVESLVRELMEGDKGKEMKQKAMEWKKMAEESTACPNGSSYKNLEMMINQVLLSIRN
ncbi:UDPGT domain-containing protein [Cephalotus follicularis]|uniref:Glycosyltransferase n=1 Tax=Cephalotus follicularis TaxID=3775 RepID=A0A1Q3ASA0_CEPFO|nr:UDPGT domain-containing protein [Cephalotus follicularis]